jgi:hypothetical protein
MIGIAAMRPTFWARRKYGADLTRRGLRIAFFMTCPASFQNLSRALELECAGLHRSGWRSILDVMPPEIRAAVALAAKR